MSEQTQICNLADCQNQLNALYLILDISDFNQLIPYSNQFSKHPNA